MTNPELISLLKQLIPIHSTIYCDPSRPDIITEIRNAGFRPLPGDNDVKGGLMFMKAKKIHIHVQSVNLQKEMKSYKFLGKGKDMVPLKVNDDAIDAGRYGTTPLRRGTTQSQPMFIR